MEWEKTLGKPGSASSPSPRYDTDRDTLHWQENKQKLLVYCHKCSFAVNYMCRFVFGVLQKCSWSHKLGLNNKIQQILA